MDHHEDRRAREGARSLHPRPDGSRRDDRRDRRSRSPAHKRQRTSYLTKDDRSTSHTDRHSSRRHRSPHKREDREKPTNAPLPFSARSLSKADLPLFRSLFAYFLSVQKQIEWEELDEREVKGRWKSFVGKWNRGELAEGWYDPDMFSRISESDPGPAPKQRKRTPEPVTHHEHETLDRANSSDENDYGPTLPQSSQHGRRAGPGIPSFNDLSIRNEMIEDDREDFISILRAARKADRAQQKERLEDLAPRADAGTQERKLEKRQAVNDKMRGFRDKSPGMEAGNEKELMGGGDSLEEYKSAKQREQRRKTEREIRREEIDRAKREEMEEKRRAWREREEGTVSMLKELARQRFG